MEWIMRNIFRRLRLSLSALMSIWSNNSARCLIPFYRRMIHPPSSRSWRSYSSSAHYGHVAPVYRSRITIHSSSSSRSSLRDHCITILRITSMTLTIPELGSDGNSLITSHPMMVHSQRSLCPPNKHIGTRGY